jgi:hypothetical protein
MSDKYNLAAMLREIQDDEETHRKKHQQLSQAEIRRVFADRKSKRENRK